MAIHTALNFTLLLDGDGVSTSITVNIQTAAILYAQTTGLSLPLTGFHINNIVAVSVTNLGGQFAPSSGSLDPTGKLLTLNFSTPPLGIGNVVGALVLA